jgi:phosphoglycolate phosphatase
VPDARLPFEAVLFDLDGTLVDTCPDIADALNAALNDHGAPAVTEPWVRHRIGNGTRALLREALAGEPGRATLESLLESFGHRYATHCGRRGHLYPEAAAVLTTLRNVGVKLALVTNKETSFAEFVLSVHGLDDAFDLRVCGDTLRVKKPDASVVHHCLVTLGVSRSAALLVGDSEIDVRTARNGGIATWAVSYGYNRGRPIAAAHPDRVIASLGELLPPLAPAVVALAPDYSPRASSSSLYLRRTPRN